MVTPVISLDSSQSGYLMIQDITSYTTGQRLLTAIQMFWSSDNFGAKVNVDQSNADSWQVPVTAQETYNVYGAYSYTWDVANNVDIGPYGMTFYNGYFYIRKNTGSDNPSSSLTNPSLDSTNWGALVVGGALDLTLIGGSNYASLTEADLYAIALLSAAHNITDVATTGVIFIDKDAFVLTKQACESWQVDININCTIITVTLYDYDGTLLVGNIPPLGTSIPIDLSAFEDGSYTLQITYVLDGLDPTIQTNWVVIAIPILEVCNANACYTKLFKYTLCKCDNPCDPCEDVTAKQKDMLTIRELITSINQMVNLQKSQYVGLYPITQSESDLLSDIGQMIDKLKIVTDRCGLCSASEDLTTNCS